MRRTALLLALAALIGLAAAVPAASALGAEKVTICHKPGTPAEQTISIASAAVEAHLRHGDHPGGCDAGPLDACVAINSGSLANLVFQGTEVVRVELAFLSPTAHAVYLTVCNADNRCALLMPWANSRQYEAFDFPWRAGDLWEDGPITIGLRVIPEPETRSISCSPG